MSRKQLVVGVAVLFVIGLALVYAALGTRQALREEVCTACNRPLHDRSRTVAIVGDRHGAFCCPACALTAGAQRHQPVTIESLTDFASDTPLDPDRAYVVEGSNLNLCMRQHVLMLDHKDPAELDFDRCSPSLIAFARWQDAQAFAREHGGLVKRFWDAHPRR